MSTSLEAISERHDAGATLKVEEQDEFIVIRGVRVLNSRSRNGGTYSDAARRSAARLANRLPIALEHTGDAGGRKYHDRVGQLREGRLTADGQVEADAWINKGHVAATQIKIDAKHFPENINLSVEIPRDGWIGEDKRHIDGTYNVRDITRMSDCSIVAQGGTTNTLFESYQEDEEDMATTATTGTINETAVDSVIEKKLAEQAKQQAVIEETNRLKKQLEESQAAAAKVAAELSKIREEQAQQAKIVGLKEIAKELKASAIGEECIALLAKLEEADARKIFEAFSALETKSPEGTPTQHFSAPSVGAKSSDSTNPFAWMG